MFSKESTLAIFEMGNVELTELRKSSIQAHNAFTTFLRGQFLSVAVS